METYILKRFGSYNNSLEVRSDARAGDLLQQDRVVALPKNDWQFYREFAVSEIFHFSSIYIYIYICKICKCNPSIARVSRNIRETRFVPESAYCILSLYPRRISQDGVRLREYRNARIFSAISFRRQSVPGEVLRRGKRVPSFRRERRGDRRRVRLRSKMRAAASTDLREQRQDLCESLRAASRCLQRRRAVNHAEALQMSEQW